MRSAGCWSIIIHSAIPAVGSIYLSICGHLTTKRGMDPDIKTFPNPRQAPGPWALVARRHASHDVSQQTQTTIPHPSMTTGISDYMTYECSRKQPSRQVAQLQKNSYSACSNRWTHLQIVLLNLKLSYSSVLAYAGLRTH